MRFINKILKNEIHSSETHKKQSHILAINGGSSSIKFAIFETDTLTRLHEGTIEKINTPYAFIQTKNLQDQKIFQKQLENKDPEEALVAFLTQHSLIETLSHTGYRIVHGGDRYQKPTLISEEVLKFLASIQPYAPTHLSSEIRLVRMFMKLLPHSQHYACFDTMFHHTLPEIAKLLPIPHKYSSPLLRRYGFHGLSYEYLLFSLEHIFKESIHTKRIVLAHLGSGASLTAVTNKQPIDTTMGLTPNSGIPMGTRSGDIELGLIEYFLNQKKMSLADFSYMMNDESGIYAVSKTTPLMEELLARENTDTDAKRAVDYFVYNVQKQIGAFAAAMNGIDMLVFTGGIGERSPEIRKRICEGLTFLGIMLDTASNETNENRIATKNSPVAIFRIPTDEEFIIAKHGQELHIKK